MTQEFIAAAKQRAADVVNGFKTPSQRNAADALKLAELLELRNRQVAALAAKLREETGGKDDLLKNIFGNVFRT